MQVVQVEEVEVQVEDEEIRQAAEVRAERVQIEEVEVRRAGASVERRQVEEEERASVQTGEGGVPGESVYG